MLIAVEDREEMGEEMEEERRRKVYSDCGVYVVKRSQRSVVIQTLRQGVTYAWWGARTSNEGPMRVHRLVVG